MNVALDIVVAAGSRPKVILLEDEELLSGFFADWIHECLTDADLAVFENGDEAWRELCRTRADLFITDELHPGMLGTKIISRLAKAGVKCSILLISGGANYQIPPLDDRPGLKVEVLPKPFSREQFQHKLNLLAGEE